MNTLMQILRMPPDERKATYGANALAKITIDGVQYSSGNDYAFIWEKTYKEEPARSDAGSIDGLNDYITYVTSHLKINCLFMSIDEYRGMMTQLLEKNEFQVVCYDPIYNRTITENMYFAPTQMAKLHTITQTILGYGKKEDEVLDSIELIAVKDFEIELIGTSTEIAENTITYNLNVPTGISWSYATTATVDKARSKLYIAGEDAIISVSGTDTKMQDITFGGAAVFIGWNSKADGSGIIYVDGEEYSSVLDTTIYAQWEIGGETIDQLLEAEYPRPISEE